MTEYGRGLVWQLYFSSSVTRFSLQRPHTTPQLTPLNMFSAGLTCMPPTIVISWLLFAGIIATRTVGWWTPAHRTAARPSAGGTSARSPQRERSKDATRHFPSKFYNRGWLSPYQLRYTASKDAATIISIPSIEQSTGSCVCRLWLFSHVAFSWGEK